MSSIGLGVNINAMRVQRTLGQATGTLSRSLERLSSGMRINSSSDDAAGLAIADRLRANTRLYTGALRNINDAISAIRIASSAVDSQKNIMTRLRELATQSMNGVYSDTQREAMDNEYQSLLHEFGRIGDATEFNNMDLLRAGRGNTLQEILFQVGINGSSTSRLSLETGDTATLSGSFNADDQSSAITNSATEASVYSATNNLVYRISMLDDNGETRDLLVFFKSIQQTGVDTGTADIFVLQEVSDTGGVGARTGYSLPAANQVLNASHDWVLGGGMTIAFNISTGQATNAYEELTFAMQFDNRAVNGTLKLDISGISFQLETNPILVQFLGYVQSDDEATSLIECTGVDTSDRASGALDLLENRFLELTDLLSRLGAAESRFGSMLRVSQVAREGSQSAESRIRDVDIAEESAQAIRAGILQRTAASVLELASQQPELVVQLLAG